MELVRGLAKILFRVGINMLYPSCYSELVAQYLDWLLNNHLLTSANVRNSPCTCTYAEYTPMLYNILYDSFLCIVVLLINLLIPILPFQVLPLPLCSVCVGHQGFSRHPHWVWHWPPFPPIWTAIGRPPSSQQITAAQGIPGRQKLWHLAYFSRHTCFSLGEDICFKFIAKMIF